MKRRFIVLLTVAVTMPLVAQETLSWDKVRANLSLHEVVLLANTELAVAEAELRAESAWRGLSVSVQPQGGYGEQSGALGPTEISLGSDLLFPLGITRDEREKKALVAETLDLRRKQAEESYGFAFVDLYRRYTDAYRAQESVKVALAERDLEAVRLQAVKQRIQQGLLTLADGLDAEAAFQDAESGLAQAQLDLRLAWFELAYTANIEPLRSEHEKGSQNPLGLVPLLEQPVLIDSSAPLNQPFPLISSAKQGASIALVQLQKIAQAERALAVFSAADLTVAPKITYATPDASVSLGFSSAAGALSLGGSWSAYQADYLTASSKIPDQAVTLSVTVSATLGGGAADRRQALAEAVGRERQRLVYTEASLELLVRSKYAAYLKAKDSVAVAERALESSRGITEAFEAKKKIGQTSPEDEAADRVLSVRTAFNLEQARISLTRAYFELVDAAAVWRTTGIDLWGNK
jgi:outer membrane protein TolC